MFKSMYVFSVLLLISSIKMEAMERKSGKKKSPTAADRQLTVDIPAASASADQGLILPPFLRTGGADESKLGLPEQPIREDQTPAQAANASSSVALVIEEKAVATLAALSAQKDADDLVVYHKPSIFTRLSDSWYGADTNVIAEIEGGVFDYRDRGAAAHRIEWAINESIKKDSPQGLRTIVSFCKDRGIEINRDFLTRARKFLKKKNREEFGAINKFFDAQSEQIRSNKKALKQLEVLYGSSYGSSDEENYDSTDKMVAKMKEAKV